MKIIHNHPRYHQKIVVLILKNKEQVCLYSWYYAINHNENEDGMKNKSHRYSINRKKSRRGHKYSKYKVPQYDDAYMY